MKDEGSISPSRAGRRLFWFLIPLVLSPAIVLLVATLLVPTQWFVDHSGISYLANAGYGTTLHNADCQVLVYGDSSALIGIDPSVIQKQTGLSTCNIAEFAGVSMLYGNYVLDTYLKQNQRPRYLIFLFAPEDFDLQSQRSSVHLFESITWRMRQPDRVAVLFRSLAHPNEVLSWAGAVIRTAFGGLNTAPMPIRSREIRTATRGQFFWDGPLLRSCSDMRVHPSAPLPQRAWISDLREHYAVGGTTVLVDAMPLADCDPRVNFFRQNLSEAVDNQVGTLPVGVFYDAHHIDAKGSAMFSALVAAQIKLRMNGQTQTSTGGSR